MEVRMTWFLDLGISVQVEDTREVICCNSKSPDSLIDWKLADLFTYLKIFNSSVWKELC